MGALERGPRMIECPICGRSVKAANINNHIDADCKNFVEDGERTESTGGGVGVGGTPTAFTSLLRSSSASASASAKKQTATAGTNGSSSSNRATNNASSLSSPATDARSTRRPPPEDGPDPVGFAADGGDDEPPPKRTKTSTSAHLKRAAPLADRMRPRTLDEVQGQSPLVGFGGVLRGLIETDRVPSMILWGGAGTGKTTIARLIATACGSRFVEINSTSSGVAECKRIFAEARNELGLTGRKTILFCDEIHRFSRSQQDVFLGPVESGQVTLVGATTENPSFKVQSALLSRCRTFTLNKLSETDVASILQRALEQERDTYAPSALVDDALLTYLAAFADGDARTALNLLELAMQLSGRADMTADKLKASLTQTLVYDRAGDQHYDAISALHKSIRGSDADAAVYYLARMLASGEDPRYIARRLVVVASEDVGLADNSLASLAMAAYGAAEKLGMPECRIPLAHTVIALALAPKSTRAYRALAAAEAALREPGTAGLPIPYHLRNAPTRLMKDLGYGKEYKYNPLYKDGKVKQQYLPDKIADMKFLEDNDLGDRIDLDLEEDALESNAHGKDKEKLEDAETELLEEEGSDIDWEACEIPRTRPRD